MLVYEHHEPTMEPQRTDRQSGSRVYFERPNRQLISTGAELEDRVRSAVNRLSPDLRIAVLLRYNDGLSYDEIADAVGVASSVVKSRLYTARQRLSHMLLGLTT